MAGEELGVGRKGHMDTSVVLRYLKRSREGEKLNLSFFSADGGIRTYESIRQVKNSVLKSDCGFKP